MISHELWVEFFSRDFAVLQKMSCRPLQSSHHLRCESTDWFLYDGRIFITFFEVLQRDVNNC